MELKKQKIYTILCWNDYRKEHVCTITGSYNDFNKAKESLENSTKKLHQELPSYCAYETTKKNENLNIMEFDNEQAVIIELQQSELIFCYKLPKLIFLTLRTNYSGWRGSNEVEIKKVSIFPLEDFYDSNTCFKHQKHVDEYHYFKIILNNPNENFKQFLNMF